MFSVRLATLAAMAWALPGFAQTTPPRVIHQDANWSGEIRINAEVLIARGVVRVSPGSTIRFEAAGAGPPSIQLGGSALREEAPAGLVLAGTAERPIIVETAEGSPPGAVLTTRGGSSLIVAHHVVFRRLGQPTDPGVFRPALLAQLVHERSDLWLSHCRFESCGPVHAEVLGTAGLMVEHCVFAATRGQPAIRVIGGGSGPKVISGNTCDAGVRLACGQALIEGNGFSGPNASISVDGRSWTGVKIANNLVHCTAASDDGRYALRCESPAGLVEGNVLIGGTYVIETAPATVRTNVLRGGAGLAPLPPPGPPPGRGRPTQTTHALIAGFAGPAEVQQNLFLGPTYAAIMIGPESAAPRIARNVFDGWGQAARVLQLDAAPRGGELELHRNVVLGYRLAAAVGADSANPLRIKSSGNFFLGGPESPYEKLTVLGQGDQHITDQARWPGAGRPIGPATRQAASSEAEVLAGRLTLRQLREQWFGAYSGLAAATSD